MHAGAVLYPSSSNKFLMLLQVSLRPIRHRNGINEEKKLGRDLSKRSRSEYRR
jgi:hypothetical protein